MRNTNENKGMPSRFEGSRWLMYPYVMCLKSLSCRVDLRFFFLNAAGSQRFFEIFGESVNQLKAQGVDVGLRKPKRSKRSIECATLDRGCEFTSNGDCPASLQRRCAQAMKLDQDISWPLEDELKSCKNQPSQI